MESWADGGGCSCRLPRGAKRGIGDSRAMSYKGTVRNGVVVLQEGAELPEGTTVRVEPEPAAAAQRPAAEVSDEELDPVWRMAELATDTGIPDLAVNLDHYLYGHPKVTDGR